MSGDMTNRSQNKYTTPRKTTTKKKKIILNVNLNVNNLNSFETKFKDLIKLQDDHMPLQSQTLQSQTLTLTLPTSCKQNHTYSYTRPQKEWKIADFEILKQMGRGKFGYVYAAKEKQTDYLVALKKMSKVELRQNDFQEQVKRQIIIQGSLHHQHILKLYGYFWDYEYVYLILQYAPEGQLFNILQRQTNKRLPEEQVSIIIRQLCSGMIYLHNNKIIHRDIKPENILVSGKNIKIGDFGWSIQTSTRRQTLCGTLDYLAPEIVKGQTHDNTIDIWQIGILTYELSVGHPPFETSTNEQTYERILNQQVQFPSFLSSQIKQFIKKVLNKRPQKRLQCLQILTEPFIVKYRDRQLKLSEESGHCA